MEAILKYLTEYMTENQTQPSVAQIAEHFRLVQELARESGLPLTLYHSREYHCDRLLRRRLQEGSLRPLGKGRTVLLEFSYRHSAEEILDAVKLVRRMGYTPLIAHAERTQPLQKDWSFAHTLRESGALLQINAGSILGREGLRQKLLCRKLLQQGLPSVVASDAHDAGIRVPELDRCAGYLEDKYGKGLARRLLCSTPKAILEGNKGE
jgi:protein-tyrosine phosphatase